MIKAQFDKMLEIREKLIKAYNDFYEDKDKFNSCKRELDCLSVKVYNAGKYDYQEIIKIICYMVSLVEGISYTYHEKELPLAYVPDMISGWVYISTEGSDYPVPKNKFRLQYICSSSQNAQKEIESKIEELHLMSEPTFSDKPFEEIKKMLTQSAQNYVQIAIFRDGDLASYEEGKISFDNNEEFYEHHPITYTNYESKICDPSFMYIVDFINFLTARKVEKEDITLTQEEMMEYARIYAEIVKEQKSRKLEEAKELKKV